MLNAAQRDHFATFGFLRLQNQLTASELARLNAEFDGCSREHSAWVPMLRPDTPFTAGLSEDDRVCAVAEELQGESVFVSTSTIARTGDTAFHADFGLVGKFARCHGLIFSVCEYSNGLSPRLSEADRCCHQTWSR